MWRKQLEAGGDLNVENETAPKRARRERGRQKAVFLNLLHIRITCACSVSKSCPTLCNPTVCSPPSSSVHGISQAKILEWVAIHQGIFPTQGSNPGLPHCRQTLYCLSHQGSPATNLLIYLLSLGSCHFWICHLNRIMKEVVFVADVCLFSWSLQFLFCLACTFFFLCWILSHYLEISIFSHWPMDDAYIISSSWLLWRMLRLLVSGWI